MPACKPAKPSPSPYRVGSLPLRMKVLYITTLHRTGGWLAEAFANDSATEIHLEESVGATAGLSRLRSEVFDAILVSHEPGVLDAIRLIEGMRAGGTEEPVIVLGTLPRQEVEAECLEVGADAYCCVEQTTTRSLLWTFSRAIERFFLIRDNCRFTEANRKRLESEHREADRLLAEQRAIVADLESIRHEIQIDSDATRLTDEERRQISRERRARTLPTELEGHYRELLRTYVVMGQGNLGREMAALADVLASAGVSARDTMQLHVSVVEELVSGLGSRSARHVLHRADLLILEVMVHLADRFRERYNERVEPPHQLLLPGFCASRDREVQAA